MPRRLTDEEARPVMLAAGLEPLVPYPGARTGWDCIHLTCGRKVTPRFGNITSGRGPCLYCANRIADPTIALTAMHEAGITPLVPYPGSHAPWKSVHSRCGKLIYPTYNNVRQGTRCEFCSGKTVIKSDAVAIMKAAGLTPLVEYPGSHAPWKSIHLCGKLVYPRYHDIRGKRSKGCGYCAGNSIDIHKIMVIMKAANLLPLDPYPGKNNEPWRSLHEICGRIVWPRYSNVQYRGYSCSNCTKYGNPGSMDQAIVYLITCSEHSAIKIGIGAVSKTRLQKHIRCGWDVYKVWENVAGAIAMAAEARVLRNWRKAGIPIACTKEQMPQGGWTETAPLDMVDIAKVRRWVNYEIRKSRKPVQS